MQCNATVIYASKKSRFLARLLEFILQVYLSRVLFSFCFNINNLKTIAIKDIYIAFKAWQGRLVMCTGVKFVNFCSFLSLKI